MTDNIKLPPMPKPHTPPVFATAANTQSVKAGYELGGYEKTPPLFDEHQLEAYAREAVRLNAQAVPDGWKLVPIEPTDEMEMAWDDAHGDGSPFHSMYSAMLSAAPAAPQPAPQQSLIDEKDALLRRALEALEGFANITNDSQGVAGYHLNGDTAEWDEFDEVDAASSTIEAIREHLGVKND